MKILEYIRLYFDRYVEFRKEYGRQTVKFKGFFPFALACGSVGFVVVSFLCDLISGIIGWF